MLNLTGNSRDIRMPESPEHDKGEDGYHHIPEISFQIKKLVLLANGVYWAHNS